MSNTPIPQPINRQPMWVDFNDRDEDGAAAVWFMPPYRSATTLRRIDFHPREGLIVWVTDGEVELVGTINFRIDRWVVVPISEYKDVPKDADYVTTSVNTDNDRSLDDINGNCKQCGHPFNPHIIIAYDTKNFSKGGEMRCPVDGCKCFNTIGFDF